MPGMDGFEVCQRLKANRETEEIPIIFLTALTETKDKIKGFELGAVDYITKPLQYEEVVARVKTHIRLQQRTAELRQRSQENERARQEADVANRVKSRFLANMSHELRTPLNAILGYTDMIQDEAAELGYRDIIPDLTKIHTAADHLLSVISDVLDLAKIEADRVELRKEVVHINEIFQAVITILASDLECSDNQFEFDCPPSVGTCYTDRTKLQQILLNLLSNAIKFTSLGKVRMAARREENTMVFEVEDTGIGIEAEHFATIFKPFSQIDSSATRRFGGTDLGLSICQRFCQLIGGTIKVESEVGKGTRFTVCLPVE